MSMRRVESIPALLSEQFVFRDKRVVDVGCGTGELTRWLARQGAHVTGIDTPTMLAKAEGVVPRAGHETYRTGVAEELPLVDSHADLMVYAASLHHVAAEKLTDAMEECARVLKPAGQALFIEPVAHAGSYYDLTRLAGDEAAIQRDAHSAILGGTEQGLRVQVEEYVYMERSFRDYEELIGTFVDEEQRRVEILAEARTLTAIRAAADGVALGAFRYRSICRLNILRKPGIPQ